MKIIDYSNINILYSFLLILFICISCNKDEKEQPTPPSMSVIHNDALVLSHDKVRFTAEIKNFRADDVLDCGFYFNGSAISYGIPSSEKFEMEIGELESLFTYSFSAYIKIKGENGGEDKVIQNPHSKSFVTDFPIVEDISPLIISDISSVTVEGKGFNSKTRLYIVTKPASESSQVEIPVIPLSVNNDKYIGSVPVIGARGKNYPTFFEGAIQPCELFIGNPDKTLMKKIGDITFRYRYSLMGTNIPANGPFYVGIYYAKDEPPIENLEVYFGDGKVDIIDKTYGYISSPHNEMIEYYTLKCNVPDGVTSGSAYKIKIISPFGEEFISFEEDELIVD